MERNVLQEKLVALYLRLNGYFTTGLIIHSPSNGNVDGELDIIGVRFSNHRQEDRCIECSDYLDIPKDSKIDLIIGEVKGGKNPLQFNESIREHEDRRYKLLTWIGLINDNDIRQISEELKIKIATKAINNPNQFERIDYKNEYELISIRPIIFAPDRDDPRNNQVRYINGKVMVDFCWKCFRPEFRRQTCETNYRSINNWGEQFENLVLYFKDPIKNEPGKLEDLYEEFCKQ